MIEKNKETILEAAETGLRYFGFDKAIYENKRNIATRKWVEVSQKPIKEVFVQ